MKNHVILLLSVVGVLGCDRLKVDEQAKIQINLPQAQSVLSAKSVAAFSGRPVPTGFTGNMPINCYLIAAGGPEADLQKNLCGRKDSAGKISGSSSFAPRKIGPWIGAAPAGTALSIDVPSGKDRVIYVVGFHALTAADCRDFRTYGFPDNEMSNPYLVGEKGGLELKPGETKDLPIEVSFNSANEFDSCQGPDFPEDSHNGGGSTPTQLVVVKDHFPYNTFNRSGGCESVDLIVKSASGSHAQFTTPTNFTVSAAQSINGGAEVATATFATWEHCQANSSATISFVLPAYKDRMPIYIKTDSLVDYVKVNPTFPLPVLSPNSFLTVDSSVKLLDLEGPSYLVPGFCYPMTFKGKYIHGSMAMDYASVSYSSGVKIYDTQALCESGSTPLTGSLSYLSGPRSAYVKIDSTAAAKESVILNTTDSGGIVTTSLTKNIYRGSGTNTASATFIAGMNQIPASTCATTAHEVTLANNHGFPIVATAPTPVTLTGSDSSVEFYDSPSCGGTLYSTLNVTIPAGSYSAKFYLKVNQANSVKTVTSASSLGTFGFTVNVGNP